jgi:NAD(P)H-flavin reductase
MAYTVKILGTEMLNHNVKRFITERPQGLNYTPGQAVLIEIPEMKGEKHPFTLVCLVTRIWNLRSSFTMITRALRTI